MITDGNYQQKYKDYTFPGKKEEEEIILVLRRFWLVLIAKLIPLFLYLLFIIFFAIWIGTNGQQLGLGILYDFWGLLSIFMLMIFWLMLFVIWIDYFLDVWIITDQRVINIEQYGLFKRVISEAEYSKIQDITSEVTGFLPTIFKYGYIYIQTAGTMERFIFKQVRYPTKIRNILMQLQKLAYLREKKREGAIMRGKE